WAGIMLATSLNFMVIARAATCDAELVFFCMLPIYLFVRGTPSRGVVGLTLFDPPYTLPGGEGRIQLRPSWLTYAPLYAAMGVAMLVKGPIGVVLPTGVLGLFLLWQKAASEHGTGGGTGWRRAARSALRAFAPAKFFGTMWAMRPLTALAAVLFVAG